MSTPELRQYQRAVIAEFHARIEQGCRRIILVAPTGSGKTIIGAEIIREKARALVKTRVYAPVNPDLTGVRSQAGDYVETQLADRMDRPKLIGDIVTHWHKFGERRKTVAFTVNVSHSVHLRDEFIKSGVRAEHVDGATPKPERDASLARLASGEIELISNCMVLTEGWDMPEVGCCILARPTKKFIRVTHGRGGNSEHRKPNLFGVTFAHSPNSHVEPATHDWRNIKTIEEAIAVAQAARADKSKTAVAMGKRAARKNRNRVHKVVPGPGTQSGPETPDFRVHKVVPKQQNSRVHKVVLLSRQLAKSSEGCASSCPADEPRQPAAQPQNNDPWADLGIPEFLRRYS
jgi:hypothetical protein